LLTSIPLSFCFPQPCQTHLRPLSRLLQHAHVVSVRCGARRRCFACACAHLA
jgi:hypothetical protein